MGLHLLIHLLGQYHIVLHIMATKCTLPDAVYCHT
jgi:hypothetical protein